MRTFLWGDRGFWLRVTLAGAALAALHVTARARLDGIGGDLSDAASRPRSAEGEEVRDADCTVIARERNRALLESGDCRAWASPCPADIVEGERVGVVGIWGGGEIRDAAIRPSAHLPFLRAAFVALSLGALAFATWRLSRRFRWTPPPWLFERRGCPTD